MAVGYMKAFWLLTCLVSVCELSPLFLSYQTFSSGRLNQEHLNPYNL
jgi:hypothetical protein